MKKLLYIKDSEEFWKVFNGERKKTRKHLSHLPYTKKMKILSRMQKLFPISNKKGFTLVEILVATTIMVIAIAAIYTSFRGGMTSWTKGTARMERFLNARAALDMMSREISSAMVNDWGAATGRRMDFCGFDGEIVQSGWEVTSSNDELFFIHPPRSDDTTGNPYEIGYWRRGSDNTLMRHYTTTMTDFIFNPVSGDQLSLNITDLQFEYYNGSTGSWQTTWDSRISGFNGATVDGTERGTLPQAVRITIIVQNELRHEDAQTFSTIVYLPTSR